MKLKLFLAPLVAILIVYFVIQFVIPAYFGVNGVSATNKKLKEINAKVVDIENKSANATELARALNYNANQQIIIRRYLPDERKDAEIISSLSSLASNQGISISSIAASVDSKSLVAEVVAAPTNSTDATALADMVDTSNEELLKNFDVDVEVIGGYVNIKKFVLDLTTFKRFNEIVSLKIVANDKNEELFTANMKVTFNYLSKLTSVVNVDKKIFANKNFDMSIVSEIESKATEVSTVSVGELGRENPFAL
jgi:Tfp pilus assembly protein PilO